MIVGLGASAGGLEALEAFLGGVPQGSGLAFVVVQHLDPNRPGLLPELLQRGTGMVVAQARDRVRVEADHVYVIPPSQDLTIAGGRLRLRDPTEPRGLRLPIDLFFRSLAADQGAGCVGVVLSGMGSDGTQGLQAIQEAGGLAMVQEPSSAAFDAMPRSAIEAGIADVVAPAGALPARLVSFLRARPKAAPAESGGRVGLSTLERIAALLRTRTGHDFSQYKKSTLRRRVERRMALHQVPGAGAYLRLLQDNPQEQRLLFDEFLIGVTSFFRDPATWASIRDRVIPELLARQPAGAQLRAWSVGCSTGEEPYSLAIAFKEALERVRPRAAFSLQVFATDLSEAAVAQARQGLFGAHIQADVSPDLIRRFFVQEDDGRFRVAKEIRDMVILAPQDIIRDPPFTKIDLLLCRNVLIYLEAELQRRLLPLFHHSLVPGGYLVLGNSETIGARTDLFSTVDARQRIYKRKASATRLDPLDFPPAYLAARGTASPGPAGRPPETLTALAEQALLRHLGPPAVLINPAGDVLYFSGRTGPYLEPTAGKADWNVFAMVREGLRQDLSGAVHSALRRRKPVVVTGLRPGGHEPGRTVSLAVHPLDEPEALRGMLLVAFSEVSEPQAGRPGPRPPGPRAERRRLAELEKDLRRAAEELQTNREEMRASHEELRSANEELQSTNEELQSTNEELTTSKEELQSMNEELQTVNAELQAKLDELSRANSDMKNLLNATDIATVFLDRDLRIRRFTAQATRLVKLLPGDVGRPITDLSSELLYADLAADVEEVLQTLVFRARQLATADGRWFTVRVLPYRTLENVIDGVVITMVDVTEAKTLEAALRRSRDRLAALLGKLPASVRIVDGAGRQVPAETVPERISSAEDLDLSSWRFTIGPEPDEGEPS
ncbi:MAG: PAS domain-containing protein [Deltaproteobacteria bacterium]|nr:PAS domain-containing protein [Deltaproteobacteria bacterium]